jgi:ATP-dependent Clp protease ATP-binding subunit ClpC
LKKDGLMKDFLTELAFKIVIQNSSKIAIDSGSQMVGSQHILLALVENPEANVKFERTGVTSEKLAKVIAKEFPVELNGGPRKAKPQFADEAKELFKEALTHSLHITQKKRMNIDMLIYSIISDNNNNAHRCLELLDVDMSHLEQVVLAALAENKGEDEVAKVETIAPDDYSATSTSSARTARRSKGTATLEQYATNMTALARSGRLDPVVGRKKEIERSLQVLSRRGKNNPILVGEPGVGKTAIIEGLAQELLTSKIVPERLRNCDIWSLDIGSLVAGTKYRGDFEGRLKKLIDEVQASDIILFIDEIHSLNTAGGGEGSVNAANILKPVLARGNMRVIGATTFDEYRKYFEKDAAMARRFQQIDVKEPTIDETILILTGLRKDYEEHHNIVLTDSAIEAAAKLSARYITDRFLPDKAIDLIDEAGARAKMNTLVSPPEVQVLEELLARTENLKKEAIKKSEFDRAAEFATQEKELIESISEAIAQTKTGATEVTAADIAGVLTSATGIPVVVPGEENKRFIRMEKKIGERVIGQKSAISAISKSVRRQRSGLKDPNRPAGSFIFAGPTGVGKTELAKALAEFMFQDEDAVITLDMSEYSEKHTVSRLFGAPPGFVGHEEGGQLTEKVRRKPYSIVLFDEIEKAHPDVFNSLLQILEEGRLTDGQGRVVDFKNTVIIMTTNVGAHKMQTAVSGFQLEENKEANYVAMKSRVLGELRREFKPEFLNRLDDIVVFPHLTKGELVQIVDIFVGRLNKRLAEQSLTLTVSDAAKIHLTTIGYDEKLGARPLRRAVEGTIADAVSEMLLYGLLDDAETVSVDFVEEKMTFNGMTAEEISNIEEEALEV